MIDTGQQRQDSFVSHRWPLFQWWFCYKAASGSERKFIGTEYYIVVTLPVLVFNSSIVTWLG